jgi:tetratricopeptide (TPR) repeat protein
LSYDDAHAPANCLMGQLYMLQLKDYQLAEHYLNQAIIANLSYPDSYKYLALLKVWTNDIDGAFKIISYAMTIKGMNRSQLLWVKANALECRMDLKGAKKVLEEAKLICIQSEVITEINQTIKRINDKIKFKNKTAKKQKKKKVLNPPI